MLDVRLAGLPPELDGLRVAHLSDFHLGLPSRGVGAVERAIDWVAERQPDLVCVTGDLLSRPSAERQLLSLLAKLPHPYVVLGNHDHAISRDPFSRSVELDRLEHGTILRDESVDVETRGQRVELAGVDPRTWLEKLEI